MNVRKGSCAFCNRFPAELSEEIFDHMLNKALNNRMVGPRMVLMAGTHIKTGEVERDKSTHSLFSFLFSPIYAENPVAA